MAEQVDNRLTGIAPVKAEYLVKDGSLPGFLTLPDDDAAESKTNHATDPRDSRDDRDRDDPRNPKRQRTDEQGNFKKLSKDEKKARQGQNKARKFKFGGDEVQVCWAFASGRPCQRGQACKMSHDLKLYLQTKPRDTYFNPTAPFTTEPPFHVTPEVSETPDNAEEGPVPTDHSFDLTTYCADYASKGFCVQGWKCRFLGAHVEKATEEEVEAGPSSDPSLPPKVVDGWKLKRDEAKIAENEKLGLEEYNHQEGSTLKLLRSKKFPLPGTVAYMQKIDPQIAASFYTGPAAAPASVEDEEEAMMNAMASTHDGGATASLTGAEVGGNDVKLRVSEKRRLNWKGKTYLAPLTTVGNLPFRRLCVDYGVDITCGEMALGQSLLQGSQDEWALTQKHRSEKTFGIQVCGGRPGLMVPAAEAIQKLCGSNVDFVDINLGCPIDLVFQKGAGSALFDAPGRLGNIVKGMNSVLGDIPLTVKFRTGISKSKNVAHKFVPRFAEEWGVSAMTLHGRSRQQRYSKLADWSYIKECVDVLRSTCTDADIPAPPIFGNGDCFSAQSYYEEMDKSGVDGIMVARGALIKPWIFTEIQERREWDISATERLEGLRKYAEYGLSHWGTDSKGVSTTRRFLCEAMSFQHRYIPIGLLERMPGQMNERPPAYRGRSELETLLASPDSEDWVKISEMFLGKRSEDFNFIPKHKSNAYGTAGGEEGNG